VNLLEESQFALNFLEPFSNCGIRFHSYLNLRIEKSTTFPQSLRFSAKILRRFRYFSPVWTVGRVISFRSRFKVLTYVMMVEGRVGYSQGTKEPGSQEILRLQAKYLSRLMPFS
jgi:hypothetical protein